MAIVYQSWFSALQSPLEWSSSEYLFIGVAIFGVHRLASTVVVGIDVGCDLSPSHLVPCWILAPRVALVLSACTLHYRPAAICAKYIQVDPHSSPVFSLKKPQLQNHLTLTHQLSRTYNLTPELFENHSKLLVDQNWTVLIVEVPRLDKVKNSGATTIQFGPHNSCLCLTLTPQLSKLLNFDPRGGSEWFSNDSRFKIKWFS